MKKSLYWVLIGVFSLIFVISAYIVIDYFVDAQDTKDDWEDISNMFFDTTPSTAGTEIPTVAPTTVPTLPATTAPTVSTTTAPTQPTVPGESTIPGTVPSDPVVPTTVPATTVAPTTTATPTDPPETTNVKKTILQRFNKLLQANSDVVGYLYIEDIVNYPILQRPGEKDYYIDRNFYGQPDKRGCIYLREACDMEKPTDVLTIYGHAMSDGQMFGMLNRYLYKSFFDSHQTFTMWDLYGEHTYQVICVFKTSGTYGVGFPFHLFDDFADEAEYEKFINGVRDLAIHDSGVETQYGDQFVCLCTCEYTTNNGRLIVVAKRIS